MKKHLLSIVAAASMLVAGVAQAAPAYEDFTISEGSVPGALANSFTADKMNGGYFEKLTINPDFTFATTAYANFGQFFKDDGTNLVSPTQLNCLGANCYGLYATFTSTGYVSGPSSFVGTAGAFELYIDPDQNTTLALGATGADPVVIGGNADDYKIAFSTDLFAALGLVGNPGAFDLWFKNFTLTALGEGYFTSPDPFHLVVNVDGDFDNFVIAPGTINVTGDVSAVFGIPEPGTLALAGLALAGIGLASRRKAAK
jgi:hypothetical protein